MPATAVVGLLLCLVTLVPAFVAYRRTRRGTVLVVAFVVVGVAAPPRVGTASDTTALDATPHVLVQPVRAGHLFGTRGREAVVQTPRMSVVGRSA